MSGDPIRLLDDPSAGALLRGDLSIASAATVQGLDHAAGLGALKAAVGAQTGAIPAVAAGTGSLAAKLLFGAAVLGGVAWWAVSQSDGPAIDPIPQPSPVQAPAATPEPAPEPEHTPAPAVAAPAVEPEPERVPEEEPGVSDPPPSAVPVGPQVEPKSVRPQPRGETRDDAREDAEPNDTVDDAVVREAKQIQAARRALGSDASRALALTQSIATEFPRGQLVEERLAIAIRALAKLGRVDEARTKAEAFLETYGRGAHATAVRRAVGLSD